MSLFAERHEHETWRDCVYRVASKYGLEMEALTDYDRNIAYGAPADQAAFDALYEWDLLDYVPPSD